MNHFYWRWHRVESELLLDYVLNISEMAKREGELTGGGLEKLARSVRGKNEIVYNDGIFALKFESNYSVRYGETVVIDWDILLSDRVPHIKVTTFLLQNIATQIEKNLPNVCVKIKDIKSKGDGYIVIEIFGRYFNLWLGRKKLGDASLIYEHESAIQIGVGEYNNKKDGTQTDIIENAMHDLILVQAIYPQVLEAIFTVTSEM